MVEEAKKTTTANWSVELNIECPHCENYYDYNASDHCAECGFEHFGQIAEACKVPGIICPFCKKEFDLDVLEGL